MESYSYGWDPKFDRFLTRIREGSNIGHHQWDQTIGRDLLQMINHDPYIPIILTGVTNENHTSVDDLPLVRWLQLAGQPKFDNTTSPQ